MPLAPSILELEQTETDVLVIGGGGAGLAACISAAESGAKVILASKVRAAGPSCTYHNAGWITYSTPDSTDELFYQVVDAGGYLNDQRLVEVFASETARLPERLTDQGVRLDLPDDEETEGGTFPSLMTMVSAKGRPRGTGLTKPLRKCAEKLGVSFLDGTSLGELAVDDGRAVGAVLLDHTEAKLVAVSARATVLASGGGAAAFARTDNPDGITGDGFTAAFRAGAELINLECVSFSVPSNKMKGIFSVQDPPSEDHLRVGSAHYFLGGVAIDTECRSTVPGLFAAGEVTGGVMGAARLGGSAIADILAFGHIAGESAATFKASGSSDDKAFAQAADYLRERATGGKLSPADLRSQISLTLWRYVGTMKTSDTLCRARDELGRAEDELQQLSVDGFEDLSVAVETASMVQLGQLLVEASLMRDETRGCYWRLDHPLPDNDRWIKNTTLAAGPERIVGSLRDVVFTRAMEPTNPRIGPGCFSYLERLHPPK